MSGIFGYYHPGAPKEVCESNLQSLAFWNKAYGKINKELMSNPSVGLGCCMEQLSKHATAETCCFSFDEKEYIVDALLYNREELLSKLGISANPSDEELLIRYIRTFGLASLSEVNGDFSGAIYEPGEGLTLFRDHMGIRPLYYYTDNTTIVFSTDIRGILAVPDIDLSMNEEWLYKTVCAYSNLSPTATEFAHIFCVPPASYIQFKNQNGILRGVEHRYWQLGKRKIRLSSTSAYCDQLRELITDSVKRRLEVFPGMVGAELSGGLDSSVISILIHRFNRECIYYSWSADPAELPFAEGDERLIIQDICEQENITCQYSNIKLNLGKDSNIAETMSGLGMNYDENEPIALRYVLTPSTNTLPICEASQYISRQGAKVVFSGHGGDEGVSHRSNPYELYYAHEYYHYLRYMWSTTHGKPHRIRKTLKACYRNIQFNRKNSREAFRNPFGAPELLSASFTSQYKEADMPSLRFSFDPKSYILSGGSRNRLDVTAMLGTYSGVRYIFPYLDYRVVDFAVSVPRHLYLKGNLNRYLFREAFRDILPSSLYRLRIKSDNSLNNIKEDPDWFDKLKKDSIDVVNRLNREYWKKYLNFDMIDAWLKEGQPSEEDRHQYESKYYCLFLCNLLDNLITKSKELPVRDNQTSSASGQADPEDSNSFHS